VFLYLNVFYGNLLVRYFCFANLPQAYINYPHSRNNNDAINDELNILNKCTEGFSQEKLLHYTSKPLDLIIRVTTIEESIHAQIPFLTTVQNVWDGDSERSTLLRRSQTWDLHTLTRCKFYIRAANGTLATWRQNLHKLELYKQQLEWNCKYNPGQQIVWVWFKIQILWILQIF
jgi:hypothetical protein